MEQGEAGSMEAMRNEGEDSQQGNEPSGPGQIGRTNCVTDRCLGRGPDNWVFELWSEWKFACVAW